MNKETAYISIPKRPTIVLSIGDKFEHIDGRVNDNIEIYKIDETDNATYIYTMSENEKDYTYGAKTFLGLYKKIK